MEPAAQPLTRYRIHATVRKCFYEDGRWWVQIEGSWESLCLGEGAHMPFFAGDEVDIVIERRK